MIILCCVLLRVVGVCVPVVCCTTLFRYTLYHIHILKKKKVICGSHSSCQFATTIALHVVCCDSVHWVPPMSRKNMSYDRIPDIESETSDDAFDNKGGSFLSRSCRKGILGKNHVIWCAIKRLKLIYIAVVFVFVGAGIIFSYFMSRHPQLVDGLGDVQVFLTSEAHHDRLSPMSASDFRERGIIIDSFSFESGDLPATASGLARATVKVDRNIQFQKIIGFGGAFTEASAYNYFKLSPATRKKFMTLYFGEGGIGYSVGRIHINSCDFSLKSYSFDDVIDDFKVRQNSLVQCALMGPC
jgi:hypothetical protein